MTFMTHVCIGCGKCPRANEAKVPDGEAVQKIEDVSKHRLSEETMKLIVKSKPEKERHYPKASY